MRAARRRRAGAGPAWIAAVVAVAMVMMMAMAITAAAFAGWGIAGWGIAGWGIGGVVRTAAANGAATVVMDRTQGPYRMVVGIIPARPVVPTTHLTIQVFAAGGGDGNAGGGEWERRPLRDTEVALEVTASGPPGAPGFGPAPVYNEQTLRYFEVDVPFAATGQWQVSLAVASERGAEVFALPLVVGEPGARVQWVWVAGMLALIVVVGIWTFWTLQRRRAGNGNGGD